MKYIIVLGDGMADLPIKEIDNKTPLMVANTKEMDRLAKLSEVGLIDTIPQGMSPGSDTANLSVLGYNPKKYYTGRSPLEALSIGVDMKDTDIAIRANIVTLSMDEVDYEEKVIIDHSASEITSEEAIILIAALKKELDNDIFKFYMGTSYRHLLIWDKGQVLDLVPPHDVLGRIAKDYLPKDEILKQMMKKSYDILSNHPINQRRIKAGLNPANSLWFWGAGTRPSLDSFEEKTGKKGVMISAVDLLKGIAVGAEMTNLNVKGADGTLHTNYEGKANAAVDALLNDGYDFAYIHVEAPDEMGHQGDLNKKIQAIEYLDQRVIKIVTDRMDKSGEEYRLMILPDHPTPISIRTHTSDPVPYMLYDSTDKKEKDQEYNEEMAKNSGNFISNGYEGIDYLFSK